MSDPEVATISADELEVITGLTDRQHRNIAKLGYFPQPKSARYELIASMKGMLKYRDDEFRKKGGALAEAKLAREQDKARQDRVEADQAEGRVIDKDIAYREIVRFVLAIKFKLLGIPSRMSQKLALTTDPLTVSEMLTAEFRAVLTDLKSDLGKIECPICKKEIAQ